MALLIAVPLKLKANYSSEPWRHPLNVYCSWRLSPYWTDRITASQLNKNHSRPVAGTSGFTGGCPQPQNICQRKAGNTQDTGFQAAPAGDAVAEPGLFSEQRDHPVPPGEGRRAEVPSGYRDGGWAANCGFAEFIRICLAAGNGRL